MIAQGSVILTSRGFVNIENIVTGDEVLDGDGNYVSVEDIETMYHKPTILVKNRGFADIECTANQRLLVRTPKSTVFGKTRTKLLKARSKKAGLLAHGDRLGLRIPPDSQEDISDDEIVILAHLVGHGAVSAKGVRFNTAFIDELPEGYDYSVNRFYIKLEDTRIRSLFLELDGMIPFHWPKDKLKVFLDLIIKYNGTHDRTRYIIMRDRAFIQSFGLAYAKVYGSNYQISDLGNSWRLGLTKDNSHNTYRSTPEILWMRVDGIEPSGRFTTVYSLGIDCTINGAIICN